MSAIKDLLMDMQEQASDRHLAKILEISYDDLIQLEWEINTNESKDGFLYAYIIEFSENSPREILEKIKRLEDGCRVYLEPWELDAEYDYINDQFDAITETKINQKTFNEELDNLKELSQLQKEGEKLKKILNRQIFISIIGNLEAFLSDIFIKLVFDKRAFYENFVKTHPEFKTRKFELREIFNQQNQLDTIVKKTILDTIFHNLPSIKNMFQDTFEIKFPSIEKMYKHVIIRHDLVHRNGKSKEGVEIKIDDSKIDELIFDTRKFVNEICTELGI